MNKTMKIEGMMCTHCTGRVEKALAAIDGVDKVEMSPGTCHKLEPNLGCDCVFSRGKRCVPLYQSVFYQGRG